MLIMISTPVWASAFVIDPAAILRTWWETNHWAGITAVSIFLAMIAATWKMPPIENETKATMVSDLFRMGRYLVFALLMIEYYEVIVSTVVNLTEIIVDIID